MQQAAEQFDAKRSDPKSTTRGMTEAAHEFTAVLRQMLELVTQSPLIDETDQSAAEAETPCCVVCLTHEVNTRLDPCRHIELCDSCAETIMASLNSKCPICRKPISKAHRLEAEGAGAVAAARDAAEAVWTLERKEAEARRLDADAKAAEQLERKGLLRIHRRLAEERRLFEQPEMQRCETAEWDRMESV